MRKPLTNEIVDARLVGRNIIRLDEYIDIHTPIEWRCKIDSCLHKWTTTPGSIIGSMNTGCPKCSDKLPLTNKIIDERLIGRNIKRIGNCLNNKTSIKFKCTIETCNYKWKTTPGSVLNNNTGCAMCDGQVPLTNDIVDNRLIGRNIKRIGNYVNADFPIKWECMVENCNYTWITNPDHVLNKNSGCAKCNFNKNQKLILKILEGYKFDFKSELNIKYINTLEFRNLRFDFYFPILNLAIEYNGKQHYEPVCFGGSDINSAKQNLIVQQERDEYKREFCRFNSITLIEIDGRKYKNKKLEQYIINLIETKTIQ